MHKKTLNPFANWFIGKLLFEIKKNSLIAQTLGNMQQTHASLIRSTIVEGLNLLMNVMQTSFSKIC